MVEYTIVGFEAVSKILRQIFPFLRLKREQAKLVLEVAAQMPEKNERMSPELLLKLACEVGKFVFFNYSKKRTNTLCKVKEFLEKSSESRRD